MAMLTKGLLPAIAKILTGLSLLVSFFLAMPRGMPDWHV